MDNFKAFTLIYTLHRHLIAKLLFT